MDERLLALKGSERTQRQHDPTMASSVPPGSRHSWAAWCRTCHTIVRSVASHELEAPPCLGWVARHTCCRWRPRPATERSKCSNVLDLLNRLDNSVCTQNLLNSWIFVIFWYGAQVVAAHHSRQLAAATASMCASSWFSWHLGSILAGQLQTSKRRRSEDVYDSWMHFVNFVCVDLFVHLHDTLC